MEDSAAFGLPTYQALQAPAIPPTTLPARKHFILISLFTNAVCVDPSHSFTTTLRGETIDQRVNPSRAMAWNARRKVSAGGFYGRLAGRSAQLTASQAAATHTAYRTVRGLYVHRIEWL